MKQFAIGNHERLLVRAQANGEKMWAFDAGILHQRPCRLANKPSRQSKSSGEEIGLPFARVRVNDTASGRRLHAGIRS
jgi:hypothetical protein